MQLLNIITDFSTYQVLLMLLRFRLGRPCLINRPSAQLIKPAHTTPNNQNLANLKLSMCSTCFPEF